MAGGDLRLNNRKLKVKPYLKIFLILLKLILRHLTWVTNYMLLKFLHQTSKSCTQTVICQVKISRAAMKAAQEAAKAAKAPVKGKKNNIFHSYLKASVVKLCFYLIYLATSQDYFKLLLFRSTNTASPQVCPCYFSIFFVKKGCQGFSLLSGLFYNLFTP
jgi:hypothetical protein